MEPTGFNHALEGAAPGGRRNLNETGRLPCDAMALADRIAAWLEDAEKRAVAIRVSYWISLAVLILGYGVIVFTLMD